MTAENLEAFIPIEPTPIKYDHTGKLSDRVEKSSSQLFDVLKTVTIKDGLYGYFNRLGLCVTQNQEDEAAHKNSLYVRVGGMLALQSLHSSNLNAHVITEIRRLFAEIEDTPYTEQVDDSATTTWYSVRASNALAPHPELDQLFYRLHYVPGEDDDIDMNRFRMYTLIGAGITVGELDILWEGMQQEKIQHVERQFSEVVIPEYTSIEYLK